MINGALWAAVTLQPVILSIGALFAALELDLQPMLDVQAIQWRKFMTFKNDKAAAPDAAAENVVNEGEPDFSNLKNEDNDYDWN